MILYYCVLLGLVGSLCQVQPLSLTREIVPTNIRIEELKANSFQSISKIKETLSSSNPMENIFYSLFQNQNNTILALMAQMQSNKTDLQSIFNIFNRGFGVELLKVNNGLLKIEPAQIEVFITNRIKSFSKALFPKDLLRQISFNDVATAEVRSVVQSSTQDLETIGLPLEDVSNALNELPQNREAIAPRSSSLITTVLWNLYKSQICSVLSNVYSNVNSTGYTIMTYLNGITIDTSSITNTAIAILANLANTIIESIDELIEYGLEIFESLYESTCSSSSRRRRDLSKQGTELIHSDALQSRSLVNQRSVTLLSIIGGIIAFIYKYTLGAALATLLKAYVLKVVTYVQGVVDTFINTTVANWVYSLISNITLSS